MFGSLYLIDHQDDAVNERRRLCRLSKEGFTY